MATLPAGPDDGAMTTTAAIPATTARPAANARLAANAATRLRAVLYANAATSAIGGAVGLLTTDRLVDDLGSGSPGWTRLVSAGLVVFGLGVATGVRARRLRATALLATVGDLSWIVATVVALALVDLTGVGQVAAVVVGFAVLDFALVQAHLRRRLA